MADEVAEPEVKGSVVAGGDQVGEPVSQAGKLGVVSRAEEIKRGAVVIAGAVKNAEGVGGLNTEERIGEDF